MAAAALVQSGCSFFALPGGGPLERDELGDWAGIAARPLPEPQHLQARVKRLAFCAHDPLDSEYSWQGGPWGCELLSFGAPREVPFTPAWGLQVMGRFNRWLRLLPGRRHGDWLYRHPSGAGSRQFYASQDEWGAGLILGDLLLRGAVCNACDVATRERVAAQQSAIVLSALGYVRIRRVRPVGVDGEPGLHGLAHPRLDATDVRYEVKDGTALLAGILGWGRVNHRLYIQVLWTPISMGEAGPSGE